MNQTISVALADSNPLMLSALAEYFEKDPKFSLVATTKNAESFLSTVTRAPVDVGVIDWTLPLLGGEKLTEVLREQNTNCRIIIYSHDDSPDVIRRAMAAGAAGFCARSNTPEKLLEIVSVVAEGRMVFPFMDIRHLQQDPLQSLTKREKNLLAALAVGRTNKELAEDIGISVNTVKFHLRNLFEKLECRNRAQAIAYYYANRSQNTDQTP